MSVTSPQATGLLQTPSLHLTWQKHFTLNFAA
jgi:hypothetical protein